MFSDVWNAIVEELRAVDLVSDSERDNLCFVHLDIDETIVVGGWGIWEGRWTTSKTWTFMRPSRRVAVGGLRPWGCCRAAEPACARLRQAACVSFTCLAARPAISETIEAGRHEP